jgi:hypothetical protein
LASSLTTERTFYGVSPGISSAGPYAFHRSAVGTISRSATEPFPHQTDQNPTFRRESIHGTAVDLRPRPNNRPARQRSRWDLAKAKSPDLRPGSARRAGSPVPQADPEWQCGT